MLKLFLVLLFGGVLPAGCPAPQPPVTTDFELPYNLHDPDHTVSLALNLNEISGLSWAMRETRLATINDEQGIIFLLDPETGEQLMHTEFHKPGDYEGIEVLDETAYVVKSTGTVYEVRHFATEGQEMIKHNGFLNGDNDVEGLCYDAETNALLLACKGQAGEGEEYASARSIYAFDLETNTFDSLPRYTLYLDDLRRYLEDHPTLRAWEKLAEFFDPSAEDLVFAPSAIAIHPQTGHFYILSSVGKLLLIMDRSGEILHLEKLDKKVHRQPEGICFAADGTMYISNESKGNGAVIHRFKYR